ncbi:MAG: DNA recombination protein RmuC [Bacteroidales bacterium]|nr:DNA recombination protein RmuC [Bacteroidales bacterium]
MPTFLQTILLLTGVASGILIAFLVMASKNRRALTALNEKMLEKEKELTTRLYDKDSRIAVLDERSNFFSSEKEKLMAELIQLREQMADKVSIISRVVAENENMLERFDNQKKEIQELQQKFKLEFENIANNLFKQHSQEFVASSGKSLNELISPLKERLQTFEKKVQDAYDLEVRDKISLKQEVKNLFDLNRKLSEDAENLTRALKGDAQKQGNWGEIVLERVLERSGLTKGVEYEVQMVVRDSEGLMLRPDVVIHLPENKHLIVDAKVSLVAYERFIRSEGELEKARLMQLHIESMRNHVKGLSEKSYQQASAFNSPDFVLLFLPVESAFSAALQNDPELFSFAWERKIVIVSPTTLLATLKTVSSIWKQEKQTQNALEIARQGGGLYDKFVGFIADLEKIGNQINTAQKTYDEAYKKLVSGSGNLVSRAEKLKKLGAKASKNLPSQYLLTEFENDDEEELSSPQPD